MVRHEVRVKAIVSDIYRTLIEIRTDEKDIGVYRSLSSYLKYQGVYLSAEELKWFFFEKKEKQKQYIKERYPEHDYRRIWQEILNENRYRNDGPDVCSGSAVMDIVKLHRALSVQKIKLYRGVYETLDGLKDSYGMGIVSDSQQDHAYPELKMLGIYGFFNAIIVSGEFGYKKPDIRLFQECLNRLQVKPSEAVYIGNDIFRDIQGARDAGMLTVLVMTKYDSVKTLEIKPDYAIDGIDEMPDVLKKIEGR